MRDPQSHIFGFTPETLGEWCEARGMASYRASQILEWVYRHGVIDPAAMSNLAKRDRELLAREMTFVSGDILSHQAATDGTRKMLVEWRDEGESERARERERGGSCGGRVDGVGDDTPVTSSLAILGSGGEQGDPTRQTECVMIPTLGGSDLRAEHGSESRATRRTACISSQVGCPVGCTFCASGLGGLDGNLSAGRIVEQVWLLDQLVKGNLVERESETERQSERARERERGGAEGGEEASARRGDLPSTTENASARRVDLPRTTENASARRGDLPRVTNVVFMGMGEPLANLASVIHSVRTLAADWGMGISARRITISTVGLPKAIDRLSEQLDLPVTLALSLHAPNDELRRELIPWAEYTSIEELLRACRAWFDKTGREITLEYILLGGVNDKAEHAQELAGVAKRLRANVNLIRYNEVGGLAYSRPTHGDVRRFQEILRERGVNVHIRASRGRDIAAACGQLRHEMSGGAG